MGNEIEYVVGGLLSPCPMAANKLNYRCYVFRVTRGDSDEFNEKGISKLTAYESASFKSIFGIVKFKEGRKSGALKKIYQNRTDIWYVSIENFDDGLLIMEQIKKKINDLEIYIEFISQEEAEDIKKISFNEEDILQVMEGLKFKNKMKLFFYDWISNLADIGIINRTIKFEKFLENCLNNEPIQINENEKDKDKESDHKDQI